MCDILKNYFCEHSKDIIGNRSAQKWYENEHSYTHDFCPKVIPNLRPDETTGCDE